MSRGRTQERGPNERGRDERGQAAVLIIGFTLVIAMTIVVVVDASAAYLRRQALSSLADGAALAAADGLRQEQVYTTGLGEQALVDPRAARQLVADYLASVSAQRRYPAMGYRVHAEGSRVVVRLSAPLDLPMPLPGVPAETQVVATAAAVVVIGD